MRIRTKEEDQGVSLTLPDGPWEDGDDDDDEHRHSRPKKQERPTEKRQ